MLRLITEIIDTCLYLIKLCSVNIVTRFERERERKGARVERVRGLEWRVRGLEWREKEGKSGAKEREKGARKRERNGRE